MYTAILVPVDGSPVGERALPIALALAARSGGRIELVHAHERYIYPTGGPMYDPRLDDEFKASMRTALGELAARLHAKSGRTVVATFLEGPVADVLTEHVAASGTDLIVMTTHGYGGFSRAWLGSVADHLVRHAHCPVLLVRPGADGAGARDTPLFRRILVPLDGSPVAEAAVEHAVMLGTPGETECRLLRVVTPQPIFAPLPYAAGRVPSDPGALERRRADARAYLEGVRRDLEENGFVARSDVVVDEQIARGILEYARHSDADLIALTTHGRGAMARLLLGSVADKILRAARTPLLLYRPPPAHGERRLREAEEAGLGPVAGNEAPTAA